LAVLRILINQPQHKIKHQEEENEPVVPDVKITTPGALSSNALLRSVVISPALNNLSLPVANRIGTQTNPPLASSFFTNFSISTPKLTAPCETSTATALAFRTKYSASAAGNAVVNGTTAAPSANAARIATANSYPPGARIAM
jgi:hypothetical protein